ncbi:hypothetical protein F2Q68_00004813 [Brassica cretica]|uniref:Uncharacterized protein n=1 Tax=Brassica cretica TaxID=69181 RepID=A0A8S9J6Y5_BRACR|nr:hypothetical protein F2Q68_00004813 [Brassica cretica]
MVEPEANFGRAGRSDTYLGELVELNQSDIYISELDELSELSDTILDLNELSDTEEGAGLVAGRNGSFSAHRKIHKKFNLGRFYTKFDQAFGDVSEVPFAFSDHIQHPAKMILLDLGRIKWYQSHFGCDRAWLELGRCRVHARSLRSDRAVCVLGRYVATELWLELTTELGLSVVRLPYSSLPVVGSDVCLFPWAIEPHGGSSSSLQVIASSNGTTKPVVPPASPMKDQGMAIPIEDRDRAIPERLGLCGIIVKGLPVSLM